MRKAEVIDALRRDVNGGSTTYSDVFSPSYLSKNLDGAYADAIARRYKSVSAINSICIQRFYLQYDPSIQIPNSGKVIYKLPQVIQLGKEDGVRYLGALNCINDWRRIRTRAELSTLMKNSYGRISNHPEQIYWMRDEGTDYIETYNNENNTEGLCEGVFQNPSENPFFNEDKDNYPLDLSLIDDVRNILFERHLVAKATESKSLPYEQPDGKPSASPRELFPTGRGAQPQ